MHNRLTDWSVNVASGSQVNAFLNSKSRQIFQLLRMHEEGGFPSEVATLTTCFSPLPLTQAPLCIAPFVSHLLSSSVCAQASAGVKALRLQKLSLAAFCVLTTSRQSRNCI